MLRAIFITTMLLVVSVANAQVTAPYWVTQYFSGVSENSSDYYGVSFIDIAGTEPTQSEIERVEGMAKRTLARQLESVVESRMDDSVAEHNGMVYQHVASKNSTKTALQLQTNPPEVWFDGTKRLWVRVSMPKDKRNEWVNEVPLKYEKKKVREIHAIVVRSRNKNVWLKTEEGRKVVFNTDEDIPVRERVIVMYLGASPRELYWEGMKLDGSFQNRR